MFNLEKYINNCYKSKTIEIETLDKISRYIDIKKQLFTAYDSSVKKPITDNILSDLLIQTSDFKLLNSACKLNDFLYQREVLGFEEHQKTLQSIKGKILQKKGV